MNKMMRELLTQIQEKTLQAKAFMDGENKDVDKATEIMDQVDALQKEFDAQKRLFEAEKMASTESSVAPVEATPEAPKMDAMTKFAKDARAGFKAEKGLNEGTAADGGYTVPVDVQTQIRQYRDAKASLLSLVTVEKVSTNTGSRTFKKRAQQTGFSKVGEGAAIGAKATPQFERINYEIEKYAGYFPVTNEVLADTDANLANVLVEWIGDESRVTANKNILAEIAKIGVTELSGLDAIKKALNITLGSAFKPTSKIITNDNGLQYLDTLKDDDGKYLLQPNPANPMTMVLCAGATKIPVVVIPNADMPNNPYYVATADTSVTEGKKYYSEANGIYTEVKNPTGNPKTLKYFEVSATKEAVPFVIGDLKEAIIYFDRQMMSIMVSNIAQVGDLNAYEQDLTLYRAIEREDVVTKDAKAVVNGFIALDK